MGIIVPKASASNPAAAPPAPAAAPLAESITVSGPPARKPPTTLDAGNLRTADYTYRTVPLVNGTREARFQVVCKQSVLDEIHAHGSTTEHAEVCGALVGDLYADSLAPWVYVEAVIRGIGAVGKQTQVTITSETWSHFHDVIEAQYPDKQIIGWYHTHPGFGIFLSGMDLFIQENFFNQEWQVAAVHDPHSREEGFFVWRGGKPVNEPFLIEGDTPESAALVASPGKSVMELSGRIKTLERRLDYILSGILALILITLAGPLLLFLVRPEIMQRIPLLQHPLLSPTSPAATEPAAPPPDQGLRVNPAAEAAEPPSTRPASELILPSTDDLGETAGDDSRAPGANMIPLKVPTAGKK